MQSNALAALEALDAEVAAEVMATGCITGDRINGLCDGETGDWYDARWDVAQCTTCDIGMSSLTPFTRRWTAASL